jgi:hypothetical protein
LLNWKKNMLHLRTFNYFPNSCGIANKTVCSMLLLYREWLRWHRMEQHRKVLQPRLYCALCQSKGISSVAWLLSHIYMKCALSIKAWDYNTYVSLFILSFSFLMISFTWCNNLLCWYESYSTRQYGLSICLITLEIMSFSEVWLSQTKRLTVQAGVSYRYTVRKRFSCKYVVGCRVARGNAHQIFRQKIHVKLFFWNFCLAKFSIVYP